jgi:RimJ/RimL family protein N-acetyltransferase
MEKFGATVGLETHINQLILAELDLRKIAAWKQLANQLAQDFELGFWDRPYPQETLEQMALIKQAMNQQPLDNLEFEDIQWTPALLQQVDNSMFQRGTGRWTYFARERSTGNLAGFTEIFWLPGKPEIAQQGDTGVLEKYRNRGLGRLLKAVMLEKVLAEKPQVKFVRTTNADLNAPMLKINQELGFHPYRSTRVWQVETEKVLAQENS